MTIFLIYCAFCLIPSQLIFKTNDHLRQIYKNFNSQKNNDKFDWSQQLQGIILSSFYVGYVLLHIPGGILSERIGGKPVIVSALLLSAILSILTPLVVNLGDAAGLIVLRISLGAVQAGFFPAVATMLSAWVPINERGRIGSLVYCGIPVSKYLGFIWKIY